jgi:uncharacterized protein YlaI
MTDEVTTSTYFCEGCESVMDDPRNKYSNRYAKFEACPLCMTNEELYQLEYGATNGDV